MVARCRGPREARWRKSLVFPRAKDMRRGTVVSVNVFRADHAYVRFNIE